MEDEIAKINNNNKIVFKRIISSIKKMKYLFCLSKEAIKQWIFILRLVIVFNRIKNTL